MKPRCVLSKAELLERGPSCFRRKLDRLQLRDLAICHTVNLDAVARGDADPEILWDIVGAALTWHRVAAVMHIGEFEMDEQMAVATHLLERWKATGRVEWDRDDYALARLGVVVMDELALIAPLSVAMAASHWSEIELDRIDRASRRDRLGVTA